MKSRLESSLLALLVLLAFGACGEDSGGSESAADGQADTTVEEAAAPGDGEDETSRTMSEVDSEAAPEAPVAGVSLPEGTPRNLVVVTIAGLRRDAVGEDTPALSGFRAGALDFVQAFTPTPELGEASSALWRGRYPIPGLGRPAAEIGAATTRAGVLARRLAESGRVTAAVTSLPELVVETKRQSFIWSREGFQIFVNDPSPENDARRVVDRASQLLGRAGDRPFALWLVFPDLDRPLDPGARDGEAPLVSRDAVYRRRLRALDEQFGRLRELLERAGAADDTAIVVHADRGRHLGRGVDGQAAAEVRADALDFDVLRVPLWMSLPGTEGARIDEVVSLVDVAPTLARVFGLPEVSDGQGRVRLRRTEAERRAPIWPALVQMRDRSRPRGSIDLVVARSSGMGALIVDHRTSVVDLRLVEDERLDVRPLLLDATLRNTADFQRRALELAEDARRIFSEVRPFFARGLDEATMRRRLLSEPIGTLGRVERAGRAPAFRGLATVTVGHDPVRTEALRPLLAGAGMPEGTHRALVEQRKIDALRFAMWGGRIEGELLDSVLRESEGDYGPRQAVALLALALADDPRAEARLREAAAEPAGQLRVAALLAEGLRGRRDVAPLISGLLEEGSYRDRLIAAGALAAATGSAAVPIVESLLVTRCAPPDVEALLWRGYTSSAGPFSLATAYAATMQDDGELPRSEWGRRLARRVTGGDPGLLFPLERSRLSDPATPLMAAVQSRVVDARDGAREGLPFSRIADWLRDAWALARAEGVSDWGLLFEAARIGHESRAYEEARALLATFARDVQGKSDAASGLVGPLVARLDTLLAGAAEPTKIELSLSGPVSTIGLARGEAVFAVNVRVTEGGGLFGGFSARGATLAAAIRQPEQKSIRPAGVRMPPLGLLPGEGARFLVVVPLVDLRPGAGQTLISLVRDGQPLDVLRQSCTIEE